MTKRFLIILVMVSWCSVGFAGDYKNLLAKAKVATKEQIHKIVNNSSLGLDLEIGIAERCIYELKVTQEFGQSCEKVILREDAINNLVNVHQVPNFSNKLREIAISIDKGEKLSYLNPSEFVRDYKIFIKKVEKITKLLSDISFLRQNL